MTESIVEAERRQLLVRKAREAAKNAGVEGREAIEHFVQKLTDDDDLEAEVDGEDDFASTADDEKARLIGVYRRWVAWFVAQGRSADDALRLAAEVEPAGARYSRELYDDEEETEMTATDKLDELAKARAADRNIPFAKAYDEILQTAEGSELYSKSLEEPKPVVTKSKPAPERKLSAGDLLLDDMTKKRVEKTGEDYYAAYRKVLDTPEGARAYELT